MNNIETLKNKTVEELNAMALSLGLKEGNYTRQELIKFLSGEDGQINIVALRKKNLTELRDIAKSMDISAPYKYKKEDLVQEIFKISKRQEIDYDELSDNATKIVKNLDELNFVTGILDLLPDGYGFLRTKNYLPSEGDIYISPSQIRKFKLKNGDEVTGVVKPPKDNENFNALIYIKDVNGLSTKEIVERPYFDDLTPIYPRDRICLEHNKEDIATRLIDIIAPIGKGQRGLIVSQPKSGKTTLLKNIAKSIEANYPELHLIVLLIDERPEEVTDIERSVNAEVVYSTFDETPKNHTRVAEMTIDRAKRLVESGMDVVILLDSLTRLSRAYNLITPPSGKTLSGGLDPISLHKPKRFFGAARNIEEGGSLTILATALVETGSKMDDIIFEEFKGTGNMEIHLDRKLSEKRIFPAIDILGSGTRKEELLLKEEELEFSTRIRNILNAQNISEITEDLIEGLSKTHDNREFLKVSKI